MYEPSPASVELTCPDGVYKITVPEAPADIWDLAECLLRPMLLAAGYHQERVDEVLPIDDDGQCLECIRLRNAIRIAAERCNDELLKLELYEVISGLDMPARPPEDED